MEGFVGYCFGKQSMGEGEMAVRKLVVESSLARLGDTSRRLDLW
jgi:hypothetical protein